MSDSRADLQALIDATPIGGSITLADGTYDVSGSPAGYYGLRLTKPITIRGSGATVLRQMAGTPASYRLVQVDAPGCTLDRIELDGQAAAQTADTHRHGVFVEADGVRLVGVDAHDFTGDGLYLYTGADHALIDACSAHENTRNGVTLSGQISGVAIRGCSVTANGAQGIDSEPGAPWTVNDVTITDSIIASTDYAIAVSGSDSTHRSTGWRIVNCTITGGVNVVWADDVALVDCEIVSATGHPAVKIYRTCHGVTVARCALSMTNASLVMPAAVYALGTGPGQAPDDVLIAANTITTAAPSSFGVRAQGVVDVTIADNVIIGAGIAASMAAGVYVRATDTATPVRAVTIVGNAITDHGARGVSIAGYSVNGTNAQISSLRIAGNAIGSVGGPQITGIVADDGTHPVVSAVIVDNGYGAGVSAGRL